MKEMISIVLAQFILFTLVEGSIYAMFYYKWCKCNKFKIYHILIMSVGNYIIATTLPPLFYQIAMILWMGICICFIQGKWKPKHFLYSACGMASVLVIEMIYCSLLELTGIVNILAMTANDTNTMDGIVNLFLHLLPVRCIETILFNKWGVNVKSWAAMIVRK